MSDPAHTPNDDVSVTLSIAEDELIRLRVREELKRQKETESSKWKILNAPLTLWFLSSVVLSLMVFLYSEHEASRSEQRAQSLRIKRLQDEVAYRLDSDLIARLFDAAGQGGAVPTPYHVAVLCLPSDQFGGSRRDFFPSLLSNPKSGNPVVSSSISSPQGGSAANSSSLAEEVEKSLLAGRFIYPDFRDRSIFSLIWELSNLTDTVTDKKLISDALNAISELRSDALSGSGQRSAVDYLDPVQTMIASWASPQTVPRRPKRSRP